MEQIVFVVFGGTGDLAKRKLAPAFYNRIKNKKVHPKSVLIGVGRRDYTDKTYKEFLFKRKDFKKEYWDKLNVKYYKADFINKDSLCNLPKLLKKIEPNNSCSRIFYLATGYEYFKRIVDQLKNAELHKHDKHMRRIVFEKPFGNSLKTSNQIDKCIHDVFSEKDIYRIDHYLGKETVMNLIAMRFANPIFKQVWNNKFIEHVHVVIDEKIGTEDRIGYYNSSGAIKDMVQNHLLQVVSLVLMEPPKTLSQTDVHDKKVEVLKNIKISSGNNIITGQYKSYKNEAKKYGIKKTNTETYAEIKLDINNKRWKGVPILLKTGKKLKQKKAYIEIQFKQEKCELYCQENIKPNRLILNIQPSQDITFEMNVPSPNKDFINTKMEFCHSCTFGANTIEAYEKLLYDIIKGDKTLFTRYDELIESWKITDKIIKLKKEKPDIYDDGSTGPKKLMH